MTTSLSRYLLAHLARMTLLVGAAVLAAALALDGLERASLLLARQAAPATAAIYLALRVGTAAHLLAPMVMALAAALAVGSLRHRGEWDAMRSLGASPGQLRLPFVAAGLALLGALVAYEGYGLPDVLERTSRYEASQVMGGPVRLGTGDGPRWWWLPDGVLVAGEVAPAADELRDVSWFAIGEDGAIEARTTVDTLVHREGAWVALSGERRSLDETGSTRPLAEEPLPLEGLSPAGIRRRLLPLAQHDLGSLWMWAAPHWLRPGAAVEEGVGAPDSRDEARYVLSARLAHPAAAGWLVVLAAMLAAALPRGRALAVAAAIGAVALANLLDLLASALAPAMGWPAWLPWSTPVALGIVVYLTWKYDASDRNHPLVQSA